MEIHTFMLLCTLKTQEKHRKKVTTVKSVKIVELADWFTGNSYFSNKHLHA